MRFSRFQSVAARSAQALMSVVVMLMAAWNAYISLRLRPDLRTTVINVAFVLVPVLLLLAVTGRVRRSMALGTAVTFGLQRLHGLKWRYLEQTWTVADLRFLVDRANWFVFRQYPEILALAAAGLLLLVLSWWLTVPGRPAGLRARVGAAGAAGMLVWSVMAWRGIHPFDPFGFNLHGHFANLVFSASTLDYQPPVVTASSAAYLARAREAPSVAPAAPRGGRPASEPDVVIWLQESTVEPTVFDIPGVRWPALSMYVPDASTRASGHLRVHSWGGGTWLTEFALLTGLSHEDFGPAGNAVYYTATPHIRYSLPRLMKRHGYQTIAISGVPKSLYNMERAQRDLGFDEVLNPLDFPEWGGKSLTTHLISDAELGAYARQVLSRPHDRPMLLFVLSMMQHGPYDSRHAVTHALDRTGLSLGHAARLSDYLSRLEATSAAAEDFGARILGEPSPIVFAYFGDHHPNLDGPMAYIDGLANPKYVTRYVVKTNFTLPQSPPHQAPLDVSFLGGLILEHAGLPLDPLFAANRTMRTLCDGRLTDCPDLPLVNSYRAHIYGDLRAATRH